MRDLQKLDPEHAKEFVYELLITLFKDGREDLLLNYYTPDVIGHYANQTFNLEDIKNRIAYVKSRYQERQYYVDEVIVLDDKFIVFRTKQMGIDSYYNKPFSWDIRGIYRLKNNLVAELWMLSDVELNYYAKPGEPEPSEKAHICEVEKQRFLTMMQDYQAFYPEPAIQLTRRQQECLYYFINGFTAKEIAKELNISYRTVQDYLAIVYQKYGCSTKQELRKKIFPEEK